MAMTTDYVRITDQTTEAMGVLADADRALQMARAAVALARNELDRVNRKVTATYHNEAA